MVATSLPESGTLLGRYRVLKHLGSGAGGAVFQAEDTLLGETVCLKLLHPAVSTHPELLGRFKREVLLARRATHRGICRVFDLHEEKGVLFVTMELVEGQTLRDLIVEKGRLGIDRSLRIVSSLCRALAAAHEAGVIHRDLKPRNIMIRPNEEACILDFGLATAGDISNMTRPGVALGTLHYIAPEVWRGEPAQAKSDLYAVGVILFNCLTGRKPFASDGSVSSIPKWILTEGLPLPSQYAPDVPRDVDELFRTATALELADRIEGALEMAEAAEACLDRRGQRAAAMFEEGATEPAQAILPDPQFDGETLPPFKEASRRSPGPEDATKISGRPSVRPLPDPQPTVVMRRRPGEDDDEHHPRTAVAAIHVTVSQSDPEKTLLIGPPSSSGPGQPAESSVDLADAGAKAPKEAAFDDDMSWVIAGHADRLPTRIVKAPTVVSQEDVAEKLAGPPRRWSLVALAATAFAATVLGGVLWMKAGEERAAETAQGAQADHPSSSESEVGSALPPARGAAAGPEDEVAAEAEIEESATAEELPAAVATQEAKERRSQGRSVREARPPPREPETTRASRRAPPKPRRTVERSPERSPKPRARVGKTDGDGHEAAYAASKTALKAAQARRGLRADDVPAVASLVDEARSEAKAGRHEQARAKLEEARRRVEATEVDQAFVQRKLKRLKGQIAQVEDGPAKDQLVTMTIEAVQCLGRSELDLANQALNRGFTLVDRAR